MIDSELCLSAETLERLSTGELAPATIREIEAHVNDCESCRQLLAAVESDSQWQDEICPVLRAPEDLTFPSADGTNDEHESQTLASVLRLLGPTDDPHMLGRIGAYEIVGVIGRGGMGVVFKAFDGALNRFVAIKMLLPHLAASGAARKRFAREGRAAAAVIDDNVMPIYNVDQWQGTPYLVTQYSRGMTLQQRIQKQGPLEVEEILRIAMQTAKGLDAAHTQGLVHRDVKPSNILLDGTVERAMLTDFGLARAVDDASITRTGTITGTPQYMSPEQTRGDNVDARSDLFGLGCVMYAMCTGRPPFRADNSYAILRLIADEDPRPIQEINSDIPLWLSKVISRLMSKQAADRNANAAEVAEVCASCLAHVQQPAAVDLPESLISLPARKRFLFFGNGIVLACLALLLAAGGMLAMISEANKATLVIKCSAADVPIRITQDDTVVKKVAVTRDGATIRIAAGEYRIEVDGDHPEFSIKNNTVILSRGGTESVEITLVEVSKNSPVHDPADNQAMKFDTPEALMRHYADSLFRKDLGKAFECLDDATIHLMAFSNLISLSHLEQMLIERCDFSKNREVVSERVTQLKELQAMLNEAGVDKSARRAVSALLASTEVSGDKSLSLEQLATANLKLLKRPRKFVAEFIAFAKPDFDEWNESAPAARPSYRITRIGDRTIATDESSDEQVDLIFQNESWRIVGESVEAPLLDLDGSVRNDSYQDKEESARIGATDNLLISTTATRPESTDHKISGSDDSPSSQSNHSYSIAPDSALLDPRVTVMPNGPVLPLPIKSVQLAGKLLNSVVIERSSYDGLELGCKVQLGQPNRGVLEEVLAETKIISLSKEEAIGKLIEFPSNFADQASSLSACAPDIDATFNEEKGNSKVLVDLHLSKSRGDTVFKSRQLVQRLLEIGGENIRIAIWPQGTPSSFSVFSNTSGGIETPTSQAVSTYLREQKQISFLENQSFYIAVDPSGKRIVSIMANHGFEVHRAYLSNDQSVDSIGFRSVNWKNSEGELTGLNINMHEPPLLGAVDIVSAELVPTSGNLSGNYSVEITLTPEATQRFAERTKTLTEDNPKVHLSVFADDTFHFAARLISPIPGGRLLISGHFSKQEAQALVDDFQEVTYFKSHPQIIPFQKGKPIQQWLKAKSGSSSSKWDKFVATLPAKGTVAVMVEGSDQAKRMLPVFSRLAKETDLEEEVTYKIVKQSDWPSLFKGDDACFLTFKDGNLVGTKVGLLTSGRLRVFVGEAITFVTPQHAHINPKPLVTFECYINPGVQHVGARRGTADRFLGAVIGQADGRTLILGPNGIAEYLKSGYACLATVSDQLGKQRQYPIDVVHSGPTRWGRTVKATYDTELAVYLAEGMPELPIARLAKPDWLPQKETDLIFALSKYPNRIRPAWISDSRQRICWHNQKVTEVFDRSAAGQRGPNYMQVTFDGDSSPSWLAFNSTGELVSGGGVLDSRSDGSTILGPELIHGTINAAKGKLQDNTLRSVLDRILKDGLPSQDSTKEKNPSHPASAFDSPNSTFQRYSRMVEQRNWKEVLACLTEDCRDEESLERVAFIHMLSLYATPTDEQAENNTNPTRFRSAGFLKELEQQFPGFTKTNTSKDPIVRKIQEKLKSLDPAERRQARLSLVRWHEGTDPDNLFTSLIDFMSRLEGCDLNGQQKSKLVDIDVRGDDAWAIIVSEDNADRKPVAFKKTTSGWMLDNLNDDSLIDRMAERHREVEGINAMMIDSIAEEYRAAGVSEEEINAMRKSVLLQMQKAESSAESSAPK